jgi:two-component system phosphate regulon sensor histidine kinase PhoR
VEWLVPLLVVGAPVVVLAIGVALARGRELGTIADRLGTAPNSEAILERVALLQSRGEAAEVTLDQRLRDLAYLADLIGVGIVRVGDDLRVEMANAAAHALLERPAGSMLGRTVIEALGDHRLEALVRDAGDRGTSTIEISLRDPDGPALVARARRSPTLGIWLVLEDVAELRRLQRIRAEFVDNLSHELRTPITTIGLLAETLARDAEAAGGSVPVKMKERIGKLEEETGTISQMISELLDLARIESGSRQLLLDDVDLGKVAVDAVERLRPFADRHRIRLVVEAPPSLPLVRGEASALAQVFTNLLHNAVKFSPPDTTVQVTVKGSHDAVEATVVDQGMGIAAVDLPRVFERFYKADRSRTSGGGTGLGLAIARHIVEGHGGRLSVSSTEGEGAAFTVNLPVAEPALQQGA